MFRKSSLAAALLMALSAGNAWALGLGDIELKSALNQPLDAEVALLSATNAELDELRVVIGSSESFARAGIDRPLFLTKLNFDVTHNAQGEPVIHISSRDFVQEPFLDFILEVSWSKGRLVREYTVLVDPPVTMPAPPPVSSAPAVAARQSAPVPQPRRFTHTGTFPTVPLRPGEYGPTRRNDTLWKVAQQVRPDTGVSMEQTMLGLLRANPQAFIGNNINNLKAGYVLRVPARDDLLSISRADARRETRAQYAAWRTAPNTAAVAQPQSTGSMTGETSAADAAAQAGAEPSLQLVSSDMEDGNTVTGGDTEGSRLDALQRELMMANEVLETQRRQDEDMSRRLATLEEQITNMQRLIQLKDNELARLQSIAGDGVTAEPVVEASAAVVEDSPLVDETVADVVADTDVVTGTDTDVVTDDAGEAGYEVFEDTETGVISGSVVDDEMAAIGELPLTDETLAEETFASGDADPVAGEVVAEDITGAEPVDEVIVAETMEPEVPVEAVAPVAEATPELPETATTPGFVDRLLQNPLYLGAGALVLALLGFFGIRRKRGVETEFQESILQAAQEDSSIDVVASLDVPQPESTEQAATESSLLSEFAVSDMGSMRSGGEADPLAEADVYLAYGRYQQAEDLIREALQAAGDSEDLNLKLLEVYLAAQNQPAFDEHAQDILARLENSEEPMWERVAEMGRELNPENPIYQVGVAASSVDGEVDEIDALEEGLDFDFSSFDKQADAVAEAAEEVAEPEPEQPVDSEPGLDAVLDFNVDLPADAAGEQQDAGLAVAMDSVEPDNITQESSLDFDINSFDLGEEEAEDSGDGQLTDLDEVSTKLDLARAYIDMGDPEGARSILDEVMQEGSGEQKDEAQGIMQMIA